MTLTNTLWALFIAGQIFSAGNMNYQQDINGYEINSIYGSHPSREKVYAIKTAEIGAVYLVTRLWPKHEREILVAAATVTLTFIAYDNMRGIAFKVRY